MNREDLFVCPMMMVMTTSRMSSSCTLNYVPSCRYSKDKPRLGDTLEIIKFLCKDFWQAVFKKQVDNLKTNHRVRGRQAAWGSERAADRQTGRTETAVVASAQVCLQSTAANSSWLQRYRNV